MSPVPSLLRASSEIEWNETGRLEETEMEGVMAQPFAAQEQAESGGGQGQ